MIITGPESKVLSPEVRPQKAVESRREFLFVTKCDQAGTIQLILPQRTSSPGGRRSTVAHYDLNKTGATVERRPPGFVHTPAGDQFGKS